MPWTHPRTEQACLRPLGPQGPHSPPHVPGGCHGPSSQVRKPQSPGRRGQAGSGQASLVPEARSWHLTVWGAQGSFLLGNWLLGRCRPARPPPGLDEEGPRVSQARTQFISCCRELHPLQRSGLGTSGQDTPHFLRIVPYSLGLPW